MRYNIDINRISNDADVRLTHRVRSKPVRRSAMSDSTPLKRCSKCGAEYPATPEYFSRQSARKDGLHSNCKPCKNASNRNWHSNNRDERNAQMMEYYASHREAYRRYAKHPNARKSTSQWVAANPEARRIHYRRASAKYRANHPAIMKARSNRTRTSLPKSDSFTDRDWEYCLQYFGYRCVACNKQAGLWHKIVPDHWIPLTKGGSSNPDNIVPLCHGIDGCNNSKQNKLPDDWLSTLEDKKCAKSIKNRVSDYFKLIKNRRLK